MLDYGSTVPINQLGDDGFYHIAWGFIKVNGTSGTVNIGEDKDLKLQLYKYNPAQIGAVTRSVHLGSVIHC